MKPKPERIERPRLDTRRLLLEPLRPRHAQDVFGAIEESRSRLRWWLPFVDQTHSPDDTQAFIRRASRSKSNIVWGIWEKEAGSSRRRAGRFFCGNVGLHAVSKDQGIGTLGYWTRKSREGRGYMTEASAAVLLWAFDVLGLDRVSIEVAPGNGASLKVIEKLGFVREGLLRRAQRIPCRQRRLDWVVAGLIRSDLRRARRVLWDYCGTRHPWDV